MRQGRGGVGLDGAAAARSHAADGGHVAMSGLLRQGGRRGFVIRCRAHDLRDVLASIRKRYGERVIRWGWEMDRKNREA